MWQDILKKDCGCGCNDCDDVSKAKKKKPQIKRCWLIKMENTE